jgi:hypothetical protein
MKLIVKLFLLLRKRKPPLALSMGVVIGIVLAIAIVKSFTSPTEWVEILAPNSESPGNDKAVRIKFRVRQWIFGVEEESCCEDYFLPDSWVGYRNKPNAHVSHKKKSYGRLIFDVDYSFDKLGRRITPQSATKPCVSFATFFGCSFTFGQGVLDSETFPSRVAGKLDDHRVYNYGVGGYGSNHIYAMLTDPEFPKGIEEKIGFAAYLFIDDHVQRTIVRLKTLYALSAGEAVTPFYTFDPAGLPVRIQSFSGPWFKRKVWFYRHFASILPLEINPWVTDEDIRLTAKLITESDRVFHEIFPGQCFIVIFYPGSRYARRIIPYLEKSRTIYLNYNDLFDPYGSGYFISVFEFHPSSLAYKVLAEKFVNDMRERGWLEDRE